MNHAEKDIKSSIKPVFEELGFLKKKTGIFVKTVSADVLGTIGLNIATGRGSGIIEINPVIGIRNQCIERLLAEILGEPFDELIPATLAGNVGYLSHENTYRPYIFTNKESIDAIVNEMRDAVKDFGLPFMQKASNLSDLVELMRTVRFGIPFVIEYRIPVGLLLLGKKIEAKEIIDKKMSEITSKHDPASLRYKKFSAQLLKRIMT